MRRLVAGLIDQVLLITLAWVLVLWWFPSAAHMEGSHLQWTAAILYWALAVTYFMWGHARTGRTLGKKLMGIKLVSTDGSRLAPMVAFLRGVIVATPILQLAVIWVWLDPRGRGMHDLMLRTEVTRAG